MLLASKRVDTYNLIFHSSCCIHLWYFNKSPFSQSPKYSWQISNNAPFCMVHCGTWDWCIMGLAEQVYWLNMFMPTYLITFLAWQFMLTSVWWTPLSKLGAFKTSRPTCPLCVLTTWGLWTSRLNCLHWSTSPQVPHWGIVSYKWWQNSGHHCFRQWLVTSLVPSQCLNQW